MTETGRTCGSLGRRRFMRVLTLCAAMVACVAPVSSAGTGGGYDPAADVNSMYSTTQYTGATAWWNAGYTGNGIDVAVIDSGVSPVPGLDAPGKVIYGPDLSLESQASNLANLDTYGHGTFIAGLIAGHDVTLATPYASVWGA
jgi:serine protease AprX